MAAIDAGSFVDSAHPVPTPLDATPGPAGVGRHRRTATDCRADRACWFAMPDCESTVPLRRSSAKTSEGPTRREESSS